MNVTISDPVKKFLDVNYDRAACRREVAEFGDLLAGNPELRERDQIRPFFEHAARSLKVISSRSLSSQTRSSLTTSVATPSSLSILRGLTKVIGSHP